MLGIFCAEAIARRRLACSIVIEALPHGGGACAVFDVASVSTALRQATLSRAAPFAAPVACHPLCFTVTLFLLPFGGHKSDPHERLQGASVRAKWCNTTSPNAPAHASARRPTGSRWCSCRWVVNGFHDYAPAAKQLTPNGACPSRVDYLFQLETTTATRLGEPMIIDCHRVL